MKTTRLLFTLLFVAVAATGFGQITGSAHDFTDGTWFTPTNGEICIACHTPHNASTTVGVLWNHDESAATFTLYPDGGTLNSTPTNPTGVSLLCLSCHDGTVALDSYGGGTGITMITGVGLVGDDLSNDHPIGITYDGALATADGGLHDPTTTSSGITAEIDDDMLFGAANDQLECSSCHDVHNEANIPGLLRVTNAGSALCLTCHNK